MDESFTYGSVTTYIIIVAINCVVGILSYILIDKLLVNFIKKRIQSKAQKQSEDKPEEKSS